MTRSTTGRQIGDTVLKKAAAHLKRPEHECYGYATGWLSEALGQILDASGAERTKLINDLKKELAE